MTPLRLLILSGPTREFIDPVRFLSNASSGRQGISLATEALRRGHEVELIQGPVALEPPPGTKVIDVISAADMLERARERHASCDVLIGVAAVSDYRPAATLAAKHKRDETTPWTLDLVPTADILFELGRVKGDRVHVGFALETDDPLENGARKLERKNLDWIVVNTPGAIGAEGGEYHLLGADGTNRRLGSLRKSDLAATLLDIVEGSSPYRPSTERLKKGPHA